MANDAMLFFDTHRMPFAICLSVNSNAINLFIYIEKARKRQNKITWTLDMNDRGDGVSHYTYVVWSSGWQQKQWETLFNYMVNLCVHCDVVYRKSPCVCACSIFHTFIFIVHFPSGYNFHIELDLKLNSFVCLRIPFCASKFKTHAERAMKIAINNEIGRRVLCVCVWSSKESNEERTLFLSGAIIFYLIHE